MLALLLALSLTMPPELVQFRDKLAAAPVEKAVIDTLFERLVEDQAYEDDGLSVALVEVPVQEPEGPIRDLLHRRAFSHLEAAEEIRKKDLVEVWEYDLSLDGKLAAVRHVLVPLGKDGEPDLDAVKLRRLPPSRGRPGAVEEPRPAPAPAAQDLPRLTGRP